MSSHHIVREKQEPALLILGMDTFDHELLGQLLEWSPTVIATTHVAEQLNAMGIKVDRVLGNDVGEVIQSDVSYISLHNSSPSEAALNVLVAESYAAVNIVTDELNIEDYIPYAKRINIVILHRQHKTYPITSGFTKWLPSGETIIINSEAQTLVTTGLLLTPDNRFITANDGVIKLEFTNDFIFITESV